MISKIEKYNHKQILLFKNIQLYVTEDILTHIRRNYLFLEMPLISSNHGKAAYNFILFTFIIYSNKLSRHLYMTIKYIVLREGI